MSSSTFRDFGITPYGLQRGGTGSLLLPPARLIGQYATTVVVALIGLTVAGLMAWFLPVPLNGLGCVSVILGCASFLLYASRHDYCWVELDGDILRAKHAYLGRTIERSVAEIDSLNTILYNAKRLEGRLAATLMGHVRGIAVCFRDQRTPLRIMRADPAMTNAQEFIEALLYRMQQVREVECVIGEHGGQRVVRQIHWKHQAPLPPLKNDTQLLMICGMGLATLFGPLLGLMGVEEQARYQIWSIPPQTLTLQSLIQNGPGANRHVLVTDFLTDGFAAREQGGKWTSVRVPLYPLEDAHKMGAIEPPLEIRAVLSSDSIANDKELAEVIGAGHVTGICSEAPRTGWTATLGKNSGMDDARHHFNPSWVIEVSRDVPSQSKVNACLAGSAACFLVVLVLAALLSFSRPKKA